MGLWTALLAIAVHNLLQIIKIQSMSMYVYVNFIQVYFLFSEYYTYLYFKTFHVQCDK